jgi:gliding motility-associated-like protein
MKKFLRERFFLAVLILLAYSAIGQPVGNFRSPNPTFKEIRDSFNAYWNGRPIERGKGYKPFKRWEWYWETRLLPDGSFPSPSINADNLQEYLKRQPLGQNRISSNANWASAGPSTSPGGYNGIGRINCIAFHPTNPNIFWVGTPAGGIWKTTDGGSSWQNSPYEFQYQSLGVSDIAVNPINPNIIYIATGDGDLGSLSSLTGGAFGDTKSIGVLKSTDGGTTWSTTGMTWALTDAKTIRRLIINPVNPSILIAATSDGIWRTTDAGLNWFRMSSTVGYHFMDVEFKPNDPSVLYASTFIYPNCTVNLFRSTNGGIDWVIRATIDSAYRANIAVTPAWPELVDVLVAQCDDGVGSLSNDRGLRGLWFSSNSGGSFDKYYSPLPSQGGCGTAGIINNTGGNLLSSYGPVRCGGQGEYDLAYAINPNNSNEKWIGGVNSWKSVDGGTSWTLKNHWLEGLYSVDTVHADKHFIAYHPLLPNVVYECNDGGLYKTTDGGTTWQDLTNGIVSSQIYRIGVAQTQSSGVITGLQDNGSKELNNNNWFERTGGDGMSCAIDQSDPSIQYTSTQNGGSLNRTTDGWITNQNRAPSINLLLPNEQKDGNPTGAWVTPFSIDASNPQTIYTAYKRLYRSNSRGNAGTWQPISPVLTSDHIRHISVAPSNSSVIYVASLDSLYRTLDAGATWSNIAIISSNTTFSNFTGIAVSPTDPLTLYVTVGGYTSNIKVFKSVNSGASWSNISGSLPNVPVNCITYQNGTNEALYIGTDVGVFYRNPALGDWIPYQQGLPHVVVTDLEISYFDNKLWAGTFGRGLWKSDLYIPPIKPVIVPSNDTTICQGQQLTLSAPAGFSVYQWTNGASTQSIIVTQAGGYAVRVTDASGNVSYWSDTVNVTVDLPPAIPTISRQFVTSNCTTQTLQLSSSSASFYQWYRNDTLIQSATNQTYQPSLNAAYRVRVYSVNRACSTLSDTVMVNLVGLNVAGLIQQDTIRACNIDSVTINASAGFTSYSWSNGANTATIRVGNSGLYSLQAICGVSSSNISYVQFNQSGNITIPDATQLRFTDQMTMMFKVKIDGSIPSGLPTLIDRVNSNDFQFTLDGASTRFNFRYAGVSNGLGVYYTLAAPQVQNAQWIYMAVVKTQDSLFMYANGQLVDRIRSTVPFPSNTNSINIGGTGTYFGRFRGGFDNLSFWNRRLTTSEITQYQECMSGRETGCVGFYKFENPSPVSDYSIYSNTAIQNSTILNYPSSDVAVCTGQTFADSVYVSIIKTGIAQNDTTICRGSSLTFTTTNTSSVNICSSSQLPINLRNGLVAFYPFCSSVNDLSGNGYNGINAGATYVTDRLGNSNSAVDFNGINANISLPTNFNNLISNELTLGMWVNLRPISDANHRYLFYSGNGEWGLNYDNSTVYFSIKLADGTWWSTGTATAPLLNRWTYLTCQFKKGAFIKLFADGNLLSQLVIPNLDLSKPNLSSFIGSAYGNSRYANASIDNAILYNRLLTNSEVSSFSTPPETYLWSTGSTANSISVNPTQSATYYLTTSDGIGSCTDSVRVTIAAVDTAVVALDPLSICTGVGQARLQAALGLASYQWLRNGVPIGGATSRTYIATQAGQYRVVLTNAISCRDTSRVITVTESPIPIAIFVTNLANQCLTGNVFAFTNNSTISSGTITYAWQFGDGNTSSVQNPTCTYALAGTYTVKLVVTSSFGCKDSTIRSVTVYPKPTGVLVNPSTTLLCEGGSVLLSATGGNTYQWLLNGGIIPGATSATHLATQPGVYTVNVVSIYGCSAPATGSVTLQLVSRPTANFIYDKYCAGFPTFFINQSNTSNSSIVNYNWNFGAGQGTSTLQNPTYTYMVPGVYNASLLITPVPCPTLTASITKPITIIPPPANQRYSAVNAVTDRDLEITARSFSGATYLWSPPTGLSSPGVINPIFNYNAEVEYLVSINTTIGCVVRDTQLVRIFKEKEIYVPKGFSPNGDGNNDKIFPRLVGVKSLKYFKIYNRWGQLLYQTSDPAEGWDGIYKGVKQPLESYVWMAEGIDIDNLTIKRTGTFLLLR